MDGNNFEEIEGRKNEALISRDPIGYFNACNELGVEPEAKDLYELGQVETEFNSIQGDLEKSIKKLQVDRKKRIPGRDFYVPRYAYELKDWIKEYCERNNKDLPKKFSSMKKNQLYAIYFRLMGA